MTRRTISDINKEQEERAARFPANRIAFQKGDWNVAVDDQREFRRFLHGEISIDSYAERQEMVAHIKRLQNE